MSRKQDTDRGTTVSSSAARLLIISVEVLWHTGVDDSSDVLFVDSEAEGRCPNHYVDLIGLPTV
jgi:hypothetical protein